MDFAADYWWLITGPEVVVSSTCCLAFFLRSLPHRPTHLFPRSDLVCMGCRGRESLIVHESKGEEEIEGKLA